MSSYRCLICRTVHDESNILFHVWKHMENTLPTLNMPKNLDEFKSRYSAVGFDVIERVSQQDAKSPDVPLPSTTHRD